MGAPVGVVKDVRELLRRRREAAEAARAAVSARSRPHEADDLDVVSVETSDAGPAALDDGTSPDHLLDEVQEAALWATLHEDPNDVDAFHRLAAHVRRRAGENQMAVSGGDPRRAADDAAWSLAEELAHSSRAWYPLIELARLSVQDDREAAMRRLGTAADRDPSGLALASALEMLRGMGRPGDAVNLGMGHWRPRDHDLEVGRNMVEASIEAARLGDARRHLAALLTHPDAEGARELEQELRPLIDAAAAKLPPHTPAGGMPLIDLRDLKTIQGG